MAEAVARAYDFRVLTLAEIDPPAIAMRESMDPRKLQELAANIREHGVLQPLGVFLAGDRYRIIYGHRRYEAARLVGEPSLPCRVHSDGNAHEEDFKLAENRLREDVNPAAEATWLADLLERKCDGAIARLCALVGATESWCNGRLDLLRGDPAVLEALRAGKINLAVAKELNKIRDDGYRGLVLGDAVREGASAAEVQRRRMSIDRMATLAEIGARPDVATVAPSTEAPLTSVDRCVLCLLDDDPLEMEYVRVHRSCHVQHLRFQRAQAGGKA